MKKSQIISSLLISLAIFSFYLFWFLLSDRRLTFLYGHLHTTPYDALTIGRYLMTALIASGIIFIIYTIVNLLIRKINSQYQPPAWLEVWKSSSLIIALPLLILLTFFGHPPLSIFLSILIVGLLSLSLYLALYMSNYILHHFKSAVFAFLDSLSLLPILVLMPVGIDFGIRRSLPIAFLIFPLIALVCGASWLFIMTGFQKKIKQPFASLMHIFLASLTTTYLVGSVIHYLISRPEHLYISTSSNFFSKNFFFQIFTFGLALGMLWFIGIWRKNNHWTNFQKPLLAILITLVVSYSTVYLLQDRNPNIWICEHDTWIKQGEPAYEQPFPEECGLIDRAFGLSTS